MSLESKIQDGVSRALAEQQAQRELEHVVTPLLVLIVAIAFIIAVVLTLLQVALLGAVVAFWASVAGALLYIQILVVGWAWRRRRLLRAGAVLLAVAAGGIDVKIAPPLWRYAHGCVSKAHDAFYDVLADSGIPVPPQIHTDPDNIAVDRIMARVAQEFLENTKPRPIVSNPSPIVRVGNGWRISVRLPFDRVFQAIPDWLISQVYDVESSDSATGIIQSVTRDESGIASDTGTKLVLRVLRNGNTSSVVLTMTRWRRSQSAGWTRPIFIPDKARSLCVALQAHLNAIR